MPEKPLTALQRSVLLTLMAEAREVPNAQLTSKGLKIEAKYRNDLRDRKLINVRGVRQPLFLELTDRGWAWCREEAGTDALKGAGHGAAAAYAILGGVQRFLDRQGLSLAEFFAQADDVTAEAVAPEPVAPEDVEARIRKAYAELASRGGESVRLADLRSVLSDLDPEQVDRTLRRMSHAGDVYIDPESNQKSLDDRDRAAAVRIGNEDKHLITIGA